MAVAGPSFKLLLILLRPQGPAGCVGCEQVKISHYGVLAYCIISVNSNGRLNVARKSRKAKRGAPARKKKGTKKAKPPKKKKKPAPKSAPAPVAPSPPVWEGFGGKTENQ